MAKYFLVGRETEDRHLSDAIRVKANTKGEARNKYIKTFIGLSPSSEEARFWEPDYIERWGPEKKTKLKV